MEVINFEEFEIYNEGNKYSFLYANFNDEKKFLSGLVAYIFDEKNLLLYSELNTGLNFNPGTKEYVKLYKNIQYFLDEELMKMPTVDLNDELDKILEGHIGFKDSEGKFLIKQDKIGKIGEYIFHLILTRYFGYKCIIPKFRITTNRNMSVFGIDTLFYDDKKNEILFGESKFSNKLKDGIDLVNRSLKNYEKSIKEEYLLVLSNDSFNLNSDFLKKYKDTIELCGTFEDFIKESNIDSIIIPIFIAHGDGNKEKIEKFLCRLNKIKSNKILKLNTKYLLISLPVIDKEKFIALAIRMVVNKFHEYELK
ncbi:Hachiman antiphage defense system protein HamA [Streptobacillus moniliformis]|uniref:Hachiman antiphage defense system protein HamA n=1 Tax=Streptobacillus moniliformis TaxID=34105 RepID=UPI0007E3C366|nr:Hachiman antiphage defense system protein HamA [Streptobacillus moniliformis]